MATKQPKLTEKQKLFIKEYLIDFNATRAAKEAGYSEHTARAIGAENLTKPLIDAALRKEIAKRNEQVGVDARYVLDNLVEMVADTKDDPKRDGAHLGALSLIGKHTGGFKERTEHSGIVTVENYSEMVKRMGQSK